MNPALKNMIEAGQLQSQLAEAELIEKEMAKQVHTFKADSVTYKCDGTGRPVSLHLTRTVSPDDILKVVTEAHDKVSQERQTRSNEFIRKMQKA